MCGSSCAIHMAKSKTKDRYSKCVNEKEILSEIQSPFIVCVCFSFAFFSLSSAFGCWYCFVFIFYDTLDASLCMFSPHEQCVCVCVCTVHVVHSI